MFLANQSFASKTFKGLARHIVTPLTNQQTADVVRCELVFNGEM
jgi:hypothetical protein